METVFNYATNFFKSMTNLFLVMVSFGIMAEILFGSPVLGMSVISNVMDIINMLGSNGVVGLMALVILYGLLDKK